MKRQRAAARAFFRLALACGLIALGTDGGSAQGSADPFAAVAPSVARLNFSGFRTMGHCTAVQIGPRAALVAGGCLRAGSFDQLHFLFGYDRQEWKAHRVGRTAFNDPTRSDLKLFCLNENLPPTRFELSAEPVAAGERVIVAGYAMPTPHKVTYRGCGITEVQGVSSFVLGCELAAGNAGAPVFALRTDRAQLLGVVAAVGADAALVLRWTGERPSTLCPPQPADTGSESNG